MAGRKPIPDHIKLLRGNPGKRAINKSGPLIPPKEPAMPLFLTSGARREWRRSAVLLVASGVLTERDGMVFGGYCETVAALTDVNKELRKLRNPLLTASGHRQHPLIYMKRGLLDQLRAYCSEFGLTPSSRCRIQVPAPLAPKADPLDTFLDGEDSVSG